jgi:hypothetical protein
MCVYVCVCEGVRVGVCVCVFVCATHHSFSCSNSLTHSQVR